MPRPLNLPSMTDYPEAENPWSDLLWGSGDCAVASYAAHDAIKSLAESWKDDWAKDHRYVLSSLEETIKALSSYYWALKLVCDREALNVQTAALVRDGRIVDGTVTPEDFAAMGRRLEAMNDLKQKVGITDEQYASLLKAAFAPVDERGAA